MIQLSCWEFPRAISTTIQPKDAGGSGLEERLKRNLPKPPDRFDGLVGMQEWFTASIKPYCKGSEGIVLRWEGSFEEAERIDQYISSGFFKSIDVCGGEHVQPFEAFYHCIEKLNNIT